jgi:cytochrome c biogenesis protein
LSDPSPQPGENKKKTRSISDRLSSPGLTVGLLFFLAAVSVAGTVLPQGEAARGLLSRFDPAAAALVGRLRLDDIFHAPWFAALGALLAANLVFCIIRRVMSTKTAERSGGSARKTRSGKEFKRLRLFLIHGGVLVLLAGALLSRILGIEAYTEIPVGETVERVSARGSDRPLDLGFRVRCDGFHFDRYESGMPKEYRSDLSFFRESLPVRKASLVVNHPVSFGGFTFYQSDFRKILKARLAVHEGGSTARHDVVEGGGFELSGGPGPLSVHVLSIVENFMNLGPVVKLLILSPEGYRELYLLRDTDRFLENVPDLYERFPSFDPAGVPPWRFELDGLETTSVTGLMVNRDPGAPVAAGGAFVLMAGILLAWLDGRGGKRPTPDGRGAEEGKE